MTEPTPTPSSPDPTPAPLSSTSSTSNMSWAPITSLICGGISVLSSCLSIVPFVGCCFCGIGPLSAIAGVIFGILGLKIEKSNFAKIGIALSIFGFVLYGVLALLVFVFRVFATPTMPR